jgi:hypothetical protein
LEQLAAIRAQIVAELETLEAELSGERVTLEAAEAVHAGVVAEWIALQELASRGLREAEGMSGPLRERILSARAPLTKAEGARGKSRALVKSLELRIAERRAAINEIDRAFTVAPFPQRQVPQVPKRKPAVIEYDSIQPSGRAP